MDEGQKQNLLGSLFEVHLSLSNHLGCLTTHANRMKGQLEEAALMMSAMISGREQKSAGQDLPTQESYADIIEQMRKTRAQIAEVEEQMKDMGYSKYIPGRNRFVSG